MSVQRMDAIELAVYAAHQDKDKKRRNIATSILRTHAVYETRLSLCSVVSAPQRF